MSLDPYQQAWKAEASQLRVTYNVESLSSEVQRSQQSLRSTIFWRDIREVSASLTMIPIWLAMGIGMSLPWTWYLTVPALIWIAGFLLLDRKFHPQQSSGPGKPIMFYVKESLTQVEHQIWLLKNVFWWYLLPCVISIMAFFIHVAWNSSSAWWEFIFVVVCSGLFLSVVYCWVYRLNQRAVRDQLEPQRQGLLKLLASMESENADDEQVDLMSLGSALSDRSYGCGTNSAWAMNWNHIIPSWVEVTAITLPMLLGAYCGWRFPIPGMGPVVFQSVVGAVIPFEIAFFYIWRRSCQKPKPSPSEPNNSAAVVDLHGDSTKAASSLPNAPAIVIILLIFFLSFLAIVALCAFMVHMKPG